MQAEEINTSISKSANQLLSCDWVTKELSNVDFGDARLRNRFLIVAKRLANQPSKNICQCGQDWGLVKSAYRFFDNPNVTYKKVLSAHQERTASRAKRYPGKVLVIQDTTKLNYSNMKSATDLGHIAMNKGSKGLMLHNSIVITDKGVPLGVIDQKIWARTKYRDEPDKNKISRLDIEEKETFRWLESMRRYNPNMSQSNYITVCDREAHFYEFFQEAKEQEAQVLVRARRADFIGARDSKLILKEQPVSKTYEISIPNKQKNNFRVAKVQLRFGTVEIERPDRLKENPKYLKNIKMHFVSLTEIDSPTEENRVDWLLLTNMPVRTAKKAKQVVAWYRQRWQVEVFFRILKSGCKIEDSLLRKNFRREPYISLQSIIAWRLLLMVNYHRACPADPATTILSQVECDALVSTIKNKICCNVKINVQTATQMIATLGGHLSRRKDAKPGPKAIWNGWERLQDFAQMFNIAYLKN